MGHTTTPQSPENGSPPPRCPVCGRTLVAGPSVEHHHPVPKSKGGRETVVLHTVCHRMLHKTFSAAELANCGADMAALLPHPDMARFVAWVAKKPPQFTDRPRTRGRRPYHRAKR